RDGATLGDARIMVVCPGVVLRLLSQASRLNGSRGLRGAEYRDRGDAQLPIFRREVDTPEILRTAELDAVLSLAGICPDHLSDAPFVGSQHGDAHFHIRFQRHAGTYSCAVPVDENRLRRPADVRAVAFLAGDRQR